MATILDGTALAHTIRTTVATRVASLSETPGLAVILVGDDPASHVYVRLKESACTAAGIHFEKHLLPADTPEKELISFVKTLNGRADIHGILVQLPLPTQNAHHVIAAIQPNKDVDGFHPENLARLRAGQPTIASATALGIVKLIDKALDPHARAGKQAAIIASALFAEPIELLLHEQGIIAHVVRPEDPLFLSTLSIADVVVIALGTPGFLKGEMIKPGAIVIDVGTTNVNGRIVGDVDRASVEPVAGALSPVPGGVGPMTIAMLLLNVLNAYQKQKRG